MEVLVLGLGARRACRPATCTSPRPLRPRSRRCSSPASCGSAVVGDVRDHVVKRLAICGALLAGELELLGIGFRAGRIHRWVLLCAHGALRTPRLVVGTRSGRSRWRGGWSRRIRSGAGCIEYLFAMSRITSTAPRRQPIVPPLADPPSSMPYASAPRPHERRDQRPEHRGIAAGPPPAAVAPELSFSACGSIGVSTPRHWRTAFGLPGRLITSVRPRVPGDGAREPCQALELDRLGAHRLGDAGRLAVDHRARRLGRHVARREAGATRRQHEVRALAELDDRRGDLVVLVGNEPRRDDVDADPARAARSSAPSSCPRACLPSGCRRPSGSPPLASGNGRYRETLRRACASTRAPARCRCSSATARPSPTRSRELRDGALADCPRTRPFVAAVAREYVKPDHPLAEGDELALVPPVSGGAGAVRASPRSPASRSTPRRVRRPRRRPVDRRDGRLPRHDARGPEPRVRGLRRDGRGEDPPARRDRRRRARPRRDRGRASHGDGRADGAEHRHRRVRRPSRRGLRRRPRAARRGQVAGADLEAGAPRGRSAGWVAGTLPQV